MFKFSLDFKGRQKKSEEIPEIMPEKPSYTKMLFIAVFVIFFFLAIVSSKVKPELMPVFMIFGFMGSVLPYLLYSYFEYSKYKKMENHFPYFLRDFAEAIRSGMTFPQALEMAAKIDYGTLTKEIKKAAAQLSWGVPFPVVLEKMGERIRGSKVIRQSIAIIIETFTAGGDVARTMDFLADSINMIRDVELERKSILSQQTMIMYFVFVIFLGLTIGLDKFLLTKFLTPPAGAEAVEQGGAMAGFLFKKVDYCLYMGWVCGFGKAFGFSGDDLYFKSLFFLMALVQSICTGAIIGVMSENNVRAGFKHMAIMLSISIIVMSIFMR